MLTEHLTEALGRSYCVLCGRGTTALWLALRAISRRDGLGEVIMPDIVCAAVLEGVLLAGFIPVFADVLPGRLTLSATSVSQLVTSRTRAVILVHLFGHVVEIDLIRQAAPDIPVIEDAVQGIGG
jgi:dTDP-4-amino-4,6-dideoxygalactose transaminase